MKPPTTTANNDKKTLVVVQELKMARFLAGNDKSSRDRALKSLTKWLKQRSETLAFTEDDFMRIWKGLFYSMWMSDKPLIQEECAENISKLLIHFSSVHDSMMFFKAGLETLCNEWFGIDQLRLDKFLMLTRRLLRQAITVLRNNKYSKKDVDEFGGVLSSTILNTDKKPPLGLFMHFTEIFLEELAKVGNGNINPDRVIDFLRPFILKMSTSNDGREIARIRKFIFTDLIRQTDLGMEYQEKYDAWKREGFPGSIDSMQKVLVDDDDDDDDDEDDDDKGGEKQDEDTGKKEEEEKVLDPRAGRVNVELPQIKFSPKLIVKALNEVKFDKKSTTKARKMIGVLSEQFQKLSKGVYPLGIKQLNLPKDDYDARIKKAVNRLVKFEKKLMGPTGNDKKRKKKDHNDDVDATKIKKKVQNQSKKDDEQLEEIDEEELDKFIKKSEAKISKARKYEKNYQIGTPLRKKTSIQKAKHRITKKRSLAQKAEFIFKRNSGIWFVFKEGGETTTTTTTTTTTDDATKKGDSQFDVSNADLGNFLETKLDVNTKVSPSDKQANNISPSRSPKGGSQSQSPHKSPVTELTATKLFTTPDKPELFPKSEWDEPPKEGEYEICIPAKKYVNKLKVEAKKNNQNVQELINETISKIKGKNRFSLDSKLVKNPYSGTGSSSAQKGNKKVKINMKLNRSQEIHEHVAQILNSPKIPYDANKKPLKPLLKSSVNSTPINPFYKKK